jgi:hypothetical protein
MLAPHSFWREADLAIMHLRRCARYRCIVRAARGLEFSFLQRVRAHDSRPIGLYPLKPDRLQGASVARAKVAVIVSVCRNANLLLTKSAKLNLFDCGRCALHFPSRDCRPNSGRCSNGSIRNAPLFEIFLGLSVRCPVVDRPFASVGSR